MFWAKWLMVNGFYITKKLFPPVIQLKTNNLQTTRLSSNETHDENSMECQSLLISTRHSSYVPVKYYLTGCNMNALLIYCIKNCHEAKNVQKVLFCYLCYRVATKLRMLEKSGIWQFRQKNLKFKMFKKKVEKDGVGNFEQFLQVSCKITFDMKIYHVYKYFLSSQTFFYKMSHSN